MDVNAPHYLLSAQVDPQSDSGRWRFVLRPAAEGLPAIGASDAEPGVSGERLDLLTVIRALESLDQPSRVTLVNCSEYLWRGVLYGIPEWRTNGWRWEFFGQMVAVKNADLWQRLDRALRFHDMECRRRRFDMPHRQPGQPSWPRPSRKIVWAVREKLSDWLKYARPVISRVWLGASAALARARGTLVSHSRWPRMVQPSRPCTTR